MLSRDDIKKAIAEGHLKIYPYEEKNMTGIGYNLSTTNFAFSLNYGILLTVHQRTTPLGTKRYVMIPANDTVLFFSKEYIEVDNTLAGTFHSKVGRICQGIGRISTTLDPTWKGQLIISVDNPTLKEIRFELDDSSGNIMTLLLHKLNTPVSGTNIHDNNKGRCDLLLQHFSRPYTNRKYQENHLVLKNFITGEFANSLNGFDSFIGEDSAPDRYSRKIQILSELRKRLLRDKVIMQEERYELGQNGKYHIFRTDEEKTAVTECALFAIERSINICSEVNPDDFPKSAFNEVIKKMDSFLEIISYELEMIDHLRRIEWQNTRIEHFAGEKSELVQLRSREEFKRQLVWFWTPTIVVGSGIVFGIHRLFVNNNGIAATIFAAFLPFLLDRWSHNWQSFRKIWRERK